MRYNSLRNSPLKIRFIIIQVTIPEVIDCIHLLPCIALVVCLMKRRPSASSVPVVRIRPKFKGPPGPLRHPKYHQDLQKTVSRFAVTSARRTEKAGSRPILSLL
ncbi:hypothetical protein HYPSUDRAFT_335428 [Hypholoma sublateritium FD-334 SS-4]|uniref:Uncharacterized protein n=1 Tax=Hypholoma sublateritium (strain FD-334 SS-4) TaxID=945553 RepID=A0A0D2KMM3_HYPSF|nr:hypothetical protein HYPSUDRAFT_335428 [Hypholoma sublateritium FD-334 SS-4]